MLFTTPDLGNYISGAILYEETLFQNHADGTPFVDCLTKIGVIPGIKVDTGLAPLPGGHEVETWCSGLDGLVERAKKYYAQGARFAKWRAVLQITSDGAPSNLSIQVRHFQTLAFAVYIVLRRLEAFSSCVERCVRFHTSRFGLRCRRRGQADEVLYCVISSSVSEDTWDGVAYCSRLAVVGE